MLKEVLAYNDYGWNVIPIRKDTKTPATAWTKYQSERQSVDFVKEWFSKDVNVAIITGAISGLVAIDVDPKHGGSVSEMMQRFPSGMVAMTPSGGCHIYFKHPGKPVSNRVGLFPGVDVRGDGGFCHAAPSVTPKGSYEWLELGEPAECPKILYSESGTVEHERTNPEDWVSNTLEYGAKSGERNQTLSKLAGFFASKELPQDITIQLLKNWNQKNEERLPLTELETTIKSVYKTTNRKQANNKTTRNATEAGFGGKDFSLMGLDDFMYQWGDKPVDWIIKDWLPDNTIAMVVSPPGSYKTWTLIDLALSVATGKPFLGMYSVNPEKKGPVFLVQQEDYAGQTAQRITLVRRSKYQDEELPKVDDNGDVCISVPEKIPLYIHPDRRLNLEDKDSIRDLEEAIKKLKPRLIILDPLYSLGGTEDFMAKLVEDMFIFKDFRDKYGVSFVIAHHTNKGQAQDRTRAWGSQFLNAFLETGWQIEPKGDKSIKIRRHFKSSDNIAAIPLSFNIDDKETWTYEVSEGLVDSTDKEESEDKVSRKNDDKPKRGPGRPPKSIILTESDIDVPEPKQVKSLPKNPFKKILNRTFHPETQKNLRIQRWLQDLVIAPDTELLDYRITKIPFVEGGSPIKEWQVELLKDNPKRHDVTKPWSKFEIFKIIYKSDIGVCPDQLAMITGRGIQTCTQYLRDLYDIGVLEKYEVEINQTKRVAYKALSTIKLEEIIPME
jgi:hypothetical protein